MTNADQALDAMSLDFADRFPFDADAMTQAATAGWSGLAPAGLDAAPTRRPRLEGSAAL